MERIVEEVVFRRRAVRAGRQLRRRNLLEQSFRAAQFGIGHFGIQHVPRDVVRLDLRLHLGEAAVVDLGQNSDPRGFGERLVEGFCFRSAQGTAPSHHGEIVRHGALRTDDRKRQTQREAPGKPEDSKTMPRMVWLPARAILDRQSRRSPRVFPSNWTDKPVD